MPAVATAHLDAQGAERQIDFVVNHNQIPRFHTEGLTGRGDTRPAAIHEGLGEQHGNFFADKAPDAIDSLVTLTLQGNAGTSGGAGNHHETDIVARLGVALARVPQTDNQLQGTSFRN
jgi:hypothetical protein